jgi:transcriptional antiterminator
MKKSFLNAKDISNILGVSEPMSYKIISQLNSELAEMGYLVVRGKVNRSYFEKRFIYAECGRKRQQESRWHRKCPTYIGSHILLNS